jgi:hypothetical protein
MPEGLAWMYTAYNPTIFAAHWQDDIRYVLSGAGEADQGTSMWSHQGWDGEREDGGGGGRWRGGGEWGRRGGVGGVDATGVEGGSADGVAGGEVGAGAWVRGGRPVVAGEGPEGGRKREGWGTACYSAIGDGGEIPSIEGIEMGF